MSDAFVASVSPSGGGGADLESLQRQGRRIDLLQRLAPQFVTSSPSGALALAESGASDDEMLRSALETSGFADAKKLADDLADEEPVAARAMWGSLPAPMRRSLEQMGYQPPAEEDGPNRFGINLPNKVFGINVPDELTLPDSTPVLGPVVGGAQHALGEGLQTAAQGVGAVAGPPVGRGLELLTTASEPLLHFGRALTWRTEEQGSPLAHLSAAVAKDGPGGLVSATRTNWNSLTEGWRNTDRGDHYVRPGHRERATELLGGDAEAMRLARAQAFGETAEEVIDDLGFLPDSPEAVELVAKAQALATVPDFQEAVHELSVGQVSIGRTLTQSIGLDDTDAGLGRVLSGTLDAGFSMWADPTLVAGAALKAARFGRWAFTLETAEDITRGTKIVDIGENARRLREGLPALELGTKITQADWRKGRAVLRWADRTSEAVRTGRYAQLMREVPTTSTVIGRLVDDHAARVANGLKGLDTPEGMLDWLRSRDGLLGLAGTRISGTSTLQRGLRLPSLTTKDRALLRAKGLWTEGIDWSRTQYAPKFRQILGEVGSPAALSRSTAQWVVAHTAGDAGRVLSALTAHTPYDTVLRLYGDEAVPEFTRLVNSGIFSGLDRPTMDAYINAFAKGSPVVRSNQVEQFLSELFTRAGVADTDFAKRFVGRHRQAYGLGDGGDLVEIGEGLMSKGGRLPDAHHADALAIPKTRDFLAASRKLNSTRWLFHNVPATWADSALGRTWKPAVLMRIGFIPRAAGEELLHFALKHGPRTYLGAKGAEWALRDEVAADLEAQLAEAIDLGQSTVANQLTQRLAEVKGGFVTAPLRSLFGAMDRMGTEALRARGVGAEKLAAPEGWRQGLAAKAHALDEKGTVSGLEWYADQLALWHSGVVEKIAEAAHIPSKAQIGGWMAERWNPNAVLAARELLRDPRAARAFTERIAGTTYTPDEFRRVVTANGAPVRRVEVAELTGEPVVQEIEMRPLPGEYAVHRLHDQGGDASAYFSSIFNRALGLRRDRVANRVVSEVLPRFTGGAVAELPGRLGHADHTALRGALNAVYGAEGEVSGKSVLGQVRALLDDPESFNAGRRKALAAQVNKAARGADLDLDGRKLVAALTDGDLAESAKRWLAYEHVDAARLTDDWRRLERTMRHAARGRLARPDMYRHLREMRHYADEGLARPVANGISKVYVPLTAEPLGELGDDFIEAAVERLTRVGGIGQERARAIATNVAAGSDSNAVRMAAGDMAGLRPVAAWGASDPRVADAIMAAYESVTGIRPTFGILEVPDAAVRTATSEAAMGLQSGAKSWKVADDYSVEPWRLIHTRPTGQTRRMVKLDVGAEWWDDVELDAARARFDAPRPGTRRLFSPNRKSWGTKPPEGPFWFIDLPEDMAERYGSRLPEDVITEQGAARLPEGAHVPGWRPLVVDRQVSEGIGEADALERIGDGVVDEVLELLSTVQRTDLDDDVLHEVVEPLLRPDRVLTDAEGRKVIEHGLDFRHLVGGTPWERLPHESYGPRMVAARDLKWSKIVEHWFSGPVDRAISSIIRKPQFLTVFGEQLASSRGLVDLFVDGDLMTAARAIGDRHGLDAEGLDVFALGLGDGGDPADLFETMAGAKASKAGLETLGKFARQRRHGLDLVRQNALNRSVSLITPFIDDTKVRSAFQQYVGNLVPFAFAEEAFLKRWARSAAESPEMIRKGQLLMHGFRSMGVVRKDDQGRDVFVYPGAGEAAQVLGALAAPIFGDNARVPYVVSMTGQVGYALPGLGDQFGVPSVGPFVAMPLEYLSRQFPELGEVERIVNQRGADQPLWRYIVPTGGGNIWEAAFGDMDAGQLASATAQTMQNMAANGQAPSENATPAEKEQFIERARGQARIILMTRALLGMTAPAAPQVETKADHLSAEFHGLLQAVPYDEAISAFLTAHPDAEPADLLASTVSTSEQTYGGADMPTEAAYRWLDQNADLAAAFPAATAWLLPRAEAGDRFSYRAWNQQLAKGLRRRKAPQELLDDMYFAAASRDYFDSRTLHEAAMATAEGEGRRMEADRWDVWRTAYFNQHPTFANMLASPEFAQRRRQSLDEMVTLSTDPDGPVPDDLREMVQRYEEYRLDTAGLRGDRRGVVAEHRRALTEEFRSWAEWFVQSHPEVSSFYLRTIERELEDSDEDGVVGAA